MTIGARTRYTINKLQPAATNPQAAQSVVRLPGLINWVAGQVLGFVAETTPTSAVHTLTFTGSGIGGTFRLQWGQDTTGTITYSGTAATMVANLQAALNELMGAGNTVVAGSGPYTVTFANELANRAVPIPTVLSALTGTTPVLTPTLTTAGHPGTGLAQVYNDGASDGTQVARCILLQDTATNYRGEVITDRPGFYPSAPVYTAGVFLCSELTGLDANGVADLGRIVNATSHTATGALLQIK